MKWILKDREKFNELCEMMPVVRLAPPTLRPLVTVGDYTSDQYSAWALIQIYDGMTKRDQEYAWIDKPNGYVIENPAGQITDEAFDTVSYALAHYNNTAIRVIGEEDLLALAVILFAPDNYVVAWGDPVKECTCYISTSPITRFEIHKIMNACGEWSE